MSFYATTPNHTVDIHATISFPPLKAGDGSQGRALVGRREEVQAGAEYTGGSVWGVGDEQMGSRILVPKTESITVYCAPV